MAKKWQKKAWTAMMREKVSQKVVKSGPQMKRQTASFLHGLGARVSQNVDKTQTRLLEAYPDMPPKVFAACVRVPYFTGRGLYKEWHLKNGKTPPKRGRMSTESRAAWSLVVLKEIGL